jgi:hypothetical protein
MLLLADFRCLVDQAAALDVETVQVTGCHVHGDLDELLPCSDAFGDDRDPVQQVTMADMLNAAIDALTASESLTRQ